MPTVWNLQFAVYQKLRSVFVTWEGLTTTLITIFQSVCCRERTLHCTLTLPGSYTPQLLGAVTPQILNFL